MASIDTELTNTPQNQPEEESVQRDVVEVQNPQKQIKSEMIVGQPQVQTIADIDTFQKAKAQADYQKRLAEIEEIKAKTKPQAQKELELQQKALDLERQKAQLKAQQEESLKREPLNEQKRRLEYQMADTEQTRLEELQKAIKERTPIDEEKRKLELQLIKQEKAKAQDARLKNILNGTVQAIQQGSQVEQLVVPQKVAMPQTAVEQVESIDEGVPIKQVQSPDQNLIGYAKTPSIQDSNQILSAVGGNTVQHSQQEFKQLGGSIQQQQQEPQIVETPVKIQNKPNVPKKEKEIVYYKLKKTKAINGLKEKNLLNTAVYKKTQESKKHERVGRPRKRGRPTRKAQRRAERLEKERERA